MPDRFDTPISVGALTRAPMVQLAGIGPRVVARLIDAALALSTLLPSAALVLALGGGRVMTGRPVLQILTLLPALFLLVVLSSYQWSSTATDGTTIGKRLMGIRIERDDGEPPGFVTGVVLRSWVFTIGEVVGNVLLCVGGVALLITDGLLALSADGKTLHDRVAGTRVVKDD